MGTSAMSPNTPATLLLCLLNHWSTSVMASSQYPCNTSVMFPNPPWSTSAMMCSQYPCNTSVMSREASLLWCLPIPLQHLCYVLWSTSAMISPNTLATPVMSPEAPLLWCLLTPLWYLSNSLWHSCYNIYKYPLQHFWYDVKYSSIFSTYVICPTMNTSSQTDNHILWS